MSNYPPGMNWSAITERPLPPGFDADPEIVADAMLELQSALDEWRDMVEAECSVEAVATVERAVDAVLAKAKAEVDP